MARLVGTARGGLRLANHVFRLEDCVDSMGARDMVWGSGTRGVLGFQKGHAHCYGTDFAVAGQRKAWTERTGFSGAYFGPQRGYRVSSSTDFGVDRIRRESGRFYPSSATRFARRRLLPQGEENLDAGRFPQIRVGGNGMTATGFANTAPNRSIEGEARHGQTEGSHCGPLER